MSIDEENWNFLTSLLPAGWKQMASQWGAVERLRGFPSAEALLRTLLLHVARGYSLRETATHAKLANWAHVSDVALLKRLRNSEEGLRALCVELLRENGIVSNRKNRHDTPLRVVDGTIVKEPGKTGSQWRILFSLQLPLLLCDFFQITAASGEGTGESLTRLPVAQHDFIVADAGYCSVAGIEYVRQRGADLLVRVNPQSFVAYSANGERIAIQRRLESLSQAGQIGEWPVILHGLHSKFSGRLCAVRKYEGAVQHALRRLNRRASKKQMQTRPETLEFAKYVLVFTTRASGSAADVLEWYRMRWQIELVFKRLKGLVQLGHLPKHDNRSSRAWLYGKLLVALLAQNLIRKGVDFSPSGQTRAATSGKSMA